MAEGAGSSSKPGSSRLACGLRLSRVRRSDCYRHGRRVPSSMTRRSCAAHSAGRVLPTDPGSKPAFLSDVRQPFRFQFAIHFVIPFFTYCESVTISTSQGSRRSVSPFTAAVSSMRLLVVCRSDAAHFLRLVAVPQNARPASGSGIADAGSVCDQLDFLQAGTASSSWLKNASTQSRTSSVSFVW